MKKTAVIYDKWLHILGGGEVVALNIAKSLLENNYQVEFLCTITPDKEGIKKLVDLDTKKIKFIEIWQDQNAIKKYTKNKDLFINTSFMDYSKGYAKINIYYTHFPTRPYYSVKGKFLYKNIFLPLTNYIKPYNIINKNKVLFYYLDQKEIYYLKITLKLDYFSKSKLEKLEPKLYNCKINNQEILFDEQNNTIHCKFKIKPKSSTITLSLNNELQNYYKITNLSISKIEHLPQVIYDFIIQKLNNRFRSGIYKDYLNNLKSYDVIFANSQFTKKWIKEYWNIDAKILYPPVELINKKYNINNIKKENIICSVGRFFTIGHGKKQEILISAFKKMCDQGLRNWKLILIGGVDKTNLNFVNKLKEISINYPIEIITNAKRNHLEKILTRSKIYWHATGYNENENKNPQKFEHFGISVIEAISAGCLAIVYNGGALKEIAEIFPKNAFLFKNIKELISITNALIDKKITENLIPPAIFKFSPGSFANNLISTINRL